MNHDEEGRASDFFNGLLVSRQWTCLHTWCTSTVAKPVQAHITWVASMTENPLVLAIDDPGEEPAEEGLLVKSPG